jgi:hypothetical protein
MLLDMIRENMTQRGDDYRDTSDCIILAKNWLEGNIKLSGVNLVYTSRGQLRKDKE